MTKPTLRLYQLEAVKDILDKKRVLIADEMGLGKCAETIAAKTAIEKRYNDDVKTLVVCPASVAEHWVDEIKLWYKKHEDTRIARIRTSTYEDDIKHAKSADFTIIGYPTLSYYGNRQEKISLLKTLDFRYGILDEAHNAKNPDSIRSMAIKKIFDSFDYLAILSGTPIPNSVIDIYMLLSLLDKDSFPINVESSRAILGSFYSLFRRDPEFVRRVLNDRMLRRTVDDYLHAKFPNLKRSDLEVTLTDEHGDTYVQVYENDDIKPAAKLMQLLKVSIDPNLVNPNLIKENLASKIGRLESCVYRSLDKCVQDVIDNNGKALIFSNLKRGVTDKLQRRYAKYGALVIDGDVSSVNDQEGGVREEIRRKFQKDKDYKILIATTVMDEGVDLTAATDVFHLSLPYAPAAFEQRNRRAGRIGEVNKDEVKVHVIRTKLDDHLTPTITEGVERLLEDKRRIITYIMQQPFSLTKRDLEEIKNGHPERSRHLIPVITNPIQSIVSHMGQLKGQGWNKILAHYEKYPEEAEYIARLYASHWDGYYGGNTATLYARVIRVLEEKEDLERKVDIACGPFSLSRRLKEPVVNLDLNQYMLKAGRILEEDEKTGEGNIALQGSFHQLPLKDESFDLAVCSLALHMSKLVAKEKGKDTRERELAFREFNRILRPKGYAVITLPHTVIAEMDFPNFYDGLGQLGFKVLPFSGFYHGPEDSKFRVYLATLQKIKEPLKGELEEQDLAWRMDQQLGIRKRSASRKRKHAMPEVKEIKKEVLHSFYHSRSKKRLEEFIRESLQK